MRDISDPLTQSAYDFSFGLINNKVELDKTLEIMLRDDLLTNWDRVHLERPNSTYRQRFTVVRDVLSRNPMLLTEEGYKDMTWLKTLRHYIGIESDLKTALQDKGTIEEVIKSNNINLGEIQAIEPISLSGSINYPVKIKTSEGTFFLRYTSSLGGESFLRYNPKETVFRYVLGEKTFNLLMGPDSTTRTIFPSFEHAFDNHNSPEADSIGGRIGQRLIIQHYYGDEYFRVQDYKLHEKSLKWLVKIFAKINASIHAATFGINSALGHNTGRKFEEVQNKFINDNKDFYRYTSPAEYEKWLREVNWVTYMATSLSRDKIKKFPDTDLRIIDLYETTRGEMLKEGIDLEKIWHHCIESSINFWNTGSIISGPDIKPSNSFYRNSDGHIRLYDFDYFAFFDGAYHLGQGLYTVLRFSTAREGIYDTEELADISKLFVNEYYENLASIYSHLGQNMPMQFKAEEYKKTVYNVGAISFFYVMVNDVVEKKVVPSQIDCIKSLTKKC